MYFSYSRIREEQKHKDLMLYKVDFSELDSKEEYI